MKLILPFLFVCSIFSFLIRSDEIDIAFGTKKFPMKGYLSMPKKPAKALIFFISGSGILDEDYSVGPNKIFLDLSKSLNRQSYATFRYPKRQYLYKNHYYAHPPKNLKEEVLEDVYSALDSLKKYPSTKDLKIFILGHSQGGGLTPYISQFRKDVYGHIILAAPARDAFNVFIDQYEHLSRFKNPYQDKFRKLFETHKHLKNPIYSQNIKEFEGLSRVYWNEWSFIMQQAPRLLEKLKKPSLIIGFSQDFQVTIKDFNVYKNQLSHKPFITLSWMENVSHMLFYTREKTYFHYFQKNRVYNPLSKRIIEWLDLQI